MEKNAEKQNKAKFITCKECCREMGDYIDGKLPVEEDIKFVAHIRSCKDCAEEFHNYYNFMTNLYFLNFGYNDRFSADEEKLLRDTEEIVSNYRKRSRFFVMIILILLAVVVALGLIIGLRHMGRIWL